METFKAIATIIGIGISTGIVAVILFICWIAINPVFDEKHEDKFNK
jgi:hypothetical protein